MAEQDPRDYRGGVHEPSDAKGGEQSWADNEGVVPREMIDDPAAERPADSQELPAAVQGEVTGRSPQDSAIDLSGGDEADATRDGGAGEGDLESASRVDQQKLAQRSDEVASR